MSEKEVIFHKMQGCGNDFAIIDNRTLGIAQEHMADWAKKICPRAFSVGADGLIFLDTEDKSVDYRWHFFNADGSRAEMCGNASRCAATLAVELGLAGPDHVFGSDAGPIKASVLGDGRVKVQLTPPIDLATNIELDLAGKPAMVQFVNTGVPHAVVFGDDTPDLDVATRGRELRFHEHFQPAGTNANFAKVTSKSSLLLRTYERGVENETYACGTGAAAAAFLSYTLGLTNSCVDVTSSGGEILNISIEDGQVFLTGMALKIYSGTLNTDALNLTV